MYTYLPHLPTHFPQISPNCLRFIPQVLTYNKQKITEVTGINFVNKSVKIPVLFLRGKLVLPIVAETNDNHFFKKKERGAPGWLS